jgi:NADPH:quinone reductase-like Zn-dependent oxidoreductase
MKAAVIKEFGGVEAMEIADVPEPKPAAGELLIEIRSAALNHLDIWVRRGRPGGETAFPHILGSDASGVVCGLGESTHGFEVGDEVVINPGLSCGCCRFCLEGEHSQCAGFGLIGMSRPGTFAQKVAVPAVCARQKPGHLDFDEAAALSLDFLTAWRMLFTRGQLVSGETVLIHGIGGGVATSALILAANAGARLLVTSSSDEKCAKAKELGAHHVLDYTKHPDVAAFAKDVTGGTGVDLIIDSVGAATFPMDLEAARKGGRIVLCGVTTGSVAQADLQALYWSQLSILGSTMGSHSEYRAMLEAVSAGGLKPVIDSVHPLADAGKATERMERGEQFGKIVLKIQ